MEATLRPLGDSGVIAHSVLCGGLRRCFWLDGRHVAAERLKISRSVAVDLGQRSDNVSGGDPEVYILSQLR